MVSDVISRAANGETLTDRGLLRLVQLHDLGVLELRRLLLSVSFGHAGSQELGVRRYHLEALARQPCLSRGLEVRAGRDRR